MMPEIVRGRWSLFLGLLLLFSNVCYAKKPSYAAHQGVNKGKNPPKGKKPPFLPDIDSSSEYSPLTGAWFEDSTQTRFSWIIEAGGEVVIATGQDGLGRCFPVKIVSSDSNRLEFSYSPIKGNDTVKYSCQLEDKKLECDWSNERDKKKYKSGSDTLVSVSKTEKLLALQKAHSINNHPSDVSGRRFRPSWIFFGTSAAAGIGAASLFFWSEGKARSIDGALTKAEVDQRGRDAELLRRLGIGASATAGTMLGLGLLFELMGKDGSKSSSTVGIMPQDGGMTINAMGRF